MLGGYAMTIETELLALTDEDGFIKPHTVVDWARANRDSEIHRRLEWNDEKAAEAYRIDQARRLIVVHVRGDEGDRATISLVQDRNSAGGYRHLNRVLENRELRLMALRQALRELRSFERRYRHIQQLARVFEEVGRVEVEAEADAVSEPVAAA
jgi:hypothetical protein